MRYRVLGPLEVTGPDGRVLDVGGAKPRALLTLLLAEAGRVVSVDRIVATLWGDDPPPTVTGTLQAYVSHLRRVLEPDRGPREAPDRAADPAARLPAARSTRPTWTCCASPSWSRRAITPSSGATRPPASRCSTRRWRCGAGSRWPSWATSRPRPPTGCGWPSCRCGRGSGAATRCWRSGRPEAAVPDLQHLVAENPLRERLWARLVTALYAADRQADALDACRRCAELLRDELGIDPGPELRDLEQAVLRQDPACSSGCRDRCCRPGRAGAGARAARPRLAETLVGRRPELATLRARRGAGERRPGRGGRRRGRGRHRQDPAGRGRGRGGPGGRLGGRLEPLRRRRRSARAVAVDPGPRAARPGGARRPASERTATTPTPRGSGSSRTSAAGSPPPPRDAPGRSSSSTTCRAPTRRRCSCSACSPATCRGHRCCWWSPPAPSGRSCPRRSPTAWPGWPASPRPPACG